MFPEPLGKRLSAPICKQINDIAAFKITENGPITLPLAPRPVVYSEYTDRGKYEVWSFADATPEGRCTCGEAKPISKSFARIGSSGISDTLQCAPVNVSCSGVRASKFRISLRENTLFAAAVTAPEPTRSQMDAYPCTSKREVRKGADIVTMDASGASPAFWAYRRQATCVNSDCDALIISSNVFYIIAIQFGQQRPC